MNEEKRKELERVALKLGKILMNILTVELFARIFLEGKGGRIKEMKEGDVVERSPRLNNNNLSEVLESYNKKCENNDYKLEKERIVQIRNTLAHGQLFGNGEVFDLPMVILKFKPNYKVKNLPDTQVMVESVEKITDFWLDDNINFLYGEI